MFKSVSLNQLMAVCNLLSICMHEIYSCEYGMSVTIQRILFMRKVLRMKFSLHHFIAVENGDAGQYYSRNEAEEAMVCPIQNKLARVFADALAHINFKLFENKRKEQSDSRRRQ